MNWESVKGIVERLLWAAALYAQGKGWITGEQSVSYVALVLAVIGAVWGWYINRPVALLDAAKSVNPPTKILDAAAKALPEVAEFKLVPEPGEGPAIARIVAQTIDKVVAERPLPRVPRPPQ